jgi:hypothetical protein
MLAEIDFKRSSDNDRWVEYWFSQFMPGAGKSAAHNKKHGLKSGARSRGVIGALSRPGRYNGAMFEQAFKEAVADLGKPEEIGWVFAGFQKFLYEEAA